MSHILEEYAKNLGVLISKPIVSEHFFPLREEKYIVIHSEDQFQSKNYKYYNIVLDLLSPVLKEKNIKIIQIDCKNTVIKGINKAFGSLSFKQYCYIISKAIAYIGTDNVYSHYASSKNIPIINLFGNVYPSISSGYWSSKDKKIDISAPWEIKPCLTMQDPKSEINLIKPELIAQSILNILHFKNKVNFKTLKIGDMFLSPIKEVVPTSFHPIDIDENEIIYLRVDYGIEEMAFLQYCQSYKVAIVSNNLIQLSSLEKIRFNVKKISVFLDEEVDTIPDRYFEILKFWGIEFQILTKNKKQFGYLKNKYFEIDVLLIDHQNEKPSNVCENSFFFSNKNIFKDGKVYASKAHLNSGKNIVDSRMNVIDTPEYWDEQEHHYYYEQN